jgi:hypothetical protein
MKGSAHTTVIDASQPISVGMMNMRSLGQGATPAIDHCSTGVVTFMPTMGGRYKAVFKDDGKQCHFTLSSVDAAGAETPMPVVFKMLKTDFMSGRRSCS